MGLLGERAAILSSLSLFPPRNCSVFLGITVHLDIGNSVATVRSWSYHLITHSSDMTLYHQCI